VDSLPQFRTKNPFLVIDEVRQTLEHAATADTIGTHEKNKAGRQGLYDCLKAHYTAADYTIILDADLNDITVDWFKENGKEREFVLIEMSQEQHPAMHTILTGGHDESRHKILELLKQGKKGVVGCTSEKEVLMTYKWIKRQQLENLRILRITGENKGGARQAAFLRNPSKEALNYDLVIHSPVIGSGVSIVQKEFTFSVLMNTSVVPANEALQMLGRNRSAREIFISFGKPRNFELVTDYETFIDNEKLQVAETIFSELNDKGLSHPEFETVEQLANTLNLSGLTVLRARIMGQRNRDLNDYENNFVLLAELAGRVFAYSGHAAKEFKIEGLKKETLTELWNNRFEANVLSEEEAEELKNKPALNQEESNRFKRHQVCQMAGVDEITLDDVANHDSGAFSQVLNIEMLLKPEADLKADDMENRKTLNRVGSKVKLQKVFNEVFHILTKTETGEEVKLKQVIDEASKCLPLPKGASNVFSFNTLTNQKAIDICKVLKKYHKELANHADYSKMPVDCVRRAGNFLRKFGVGIWSPKREKTDAKVERKYDVFFNLEIVSYVNNRAGCSDDS
jgi:hypothetical protein